MPEVTTIDEARDLVGRTFTHEGYTKTILRVNVVVCLVICKVTFPSGSSTVLPFRFDEFNDWLSEAEEVNDG